MGGGEEKLQDEREHACVRERERTNFHFNAFRGFSGNLDYGVSISI